jgi:hypothetical protein
MIELLIILLCDVESGNDPSALGDYRNGVPYAHGILQIHEAVVVDVNAHQDRMIYTHNDAFHPELAKEMFRVYMARYATKQRLGREPTMEDMARIWNGGPNGYRKDATKIYWQKVQAVMLLRERIRDPE